MLPGIHENDLLMLCHIINFFICAWMKGPGVPPLKEGVHVHCIWGGGVCGGGILAGYSSASIPEGTHGLH